MSEPEFKYLSVGKRGFRWLKSYKTSTGKTAYKFTLERPKDFLKVEKAYKASPPFVSEQVAFKGERASVAKANEPVSDKYESLKELQDLGEMRKMSESKSEVKPKRKYVRKPKKEMIRTTDVLEAVKGKEIEVTTCEKSKKKIPFSGLD